MDLRDQILAGNDRFNVDIIIIHIGNDSKLFAEIVKIAHCGKLPLAPRAAWIMTACCDRFPYLIIPHLDEVVAGFDKHVHPGITRCVFRTLCLIDIPEKHQGILYDYCQHYLENTDVPIAIRVFAMQLMYNISDQEPDLKPELLLLFETLVVPGSRTGFISRGGKLIDKLRKSLEKRDQ